jgi:RHS repeat-associated protein
MADGKGREGIAPRQRREWSCSRAVLLLIRVVAVLVVASGVARAQSYLSASGSPTFVAPEPIEQGFTDDANGNLHLEFGFGSYPQRATSQLLPVKYVYDSNMVWNIGCNTSCTWAPSNYNSYGWRLSANTGTLTGTNCSTQCTEWIFTDSAGTSRYFEVSTGTCPIPNSYASDSSGYMLNLCQTGVYAPDGSLVYSATYEQPASPGAEDTNGNYAPWGTGDTLGRPLPTTTLNCNGNSNETCYTVPNSQYGNAQGGTSTYTVTIATINVKTAFGQSGVSEFSGTMNVVQSIALPDGTSYTFKFDCDSTLNSACGSPHGQTAYYGLLTSMTLPTGGVVSYGWTTFSDSYSNKSRWLSSRQTAGGTWSYSPQVVSSCSSTQYGSSCQQKVTVTKPSGDHSVYTFWLNNGAWPVTIQSYDASSNLLSTVNNTYDFSQSCPFTNCHGDAYIRLLTAQTTVSTPSGSITKQTKYQYDSPQTGNITGRQEWGYYSGTSPSFPSIPDRATYTTYLTTGTNDINRPSSVTLCSNSGSDPACTGGGGKIQQTLYTYDSYSGCPSGLSQVNGVMNHDDTDFGSGYTTRGNATQVQNWVAGSSYLTTRLCYDTTGQVTQQTDSNGNVTTFSYSDHFYSDNGTNSMNSYAPSKPTNAYVTSVTQPIIGTSTANYYYGSGKTAFSADPNGATSYSHFMDVFDRSTEDDYALVGWDKSVYTSPTQTDVYLAVSDTIASQNCQSCQHKELLTDTFGRKITEELANYPSGASKVDTAYDPDGRVYTVSHPYQGSSGQVYEYYHYDGLDRTTQNTHPDSEYATALYGPAVASGGGVSSQQGSPTTYGYGYPVLYRDEAGKERQEWVDGFGRIIEVDEPVTAATSGSGSVTISGSEQSTQVCTQHLAGGDCGRYVTRYDSGTVSITVNGVLSSVSYGQGSTSSSIATALSSAINSNGSINSLVSASTSSTTVSITAKQGGSQTNYSLSAAATTSDPTDFPDGSFYAGPSGSSLTGGSNSGSSFATPQVTLYKFDSAGNVTQVIQGKQTRTFAYDGLGRPTSISTPESGTETLAYSVSGSLCSGDPQSVCQKTDARDVITSYFYDALNRLTGKSYTIPQGSAVAAMPNVCTTSTNQSANTCRFYDQGGAGAFALGRPTQLVDPSGSETYTYDQAGRVTQLAKVIGSNTYTTSYQYNAGDELSQVSYPSGRAVELSYNIVGQLCEIAPQTTACGSSSSPFATAYAYSPSGQLTGFNYGNGVAATYTYSANRSQLSSVAYVKGTNTLFDLNYFYQLDSTNCPGGNNLGNDGQIQCITDGVESGRSANYTYDVLGRLSSALTNGSSAFPQWGYTWTYDQYGNRLCQNLTAGNGYQGCLSFAYPGGAQTNQPDGWCFDASGNLLAKSGTCPPTAPNFVYDGENRMVADPVAGATYTYDGNGTRVQKCLPSCTNPSSSTVFVFSGSQDIAEYDNGAAPSSPSREFIYSDSIPGSGLLATITGVSSPTTTYFHDDHLSWRVSTDGTSGSPTYGQVVGQQGTDPWGELVYSSNGNEFEFTTYQRDAESGLDYAMARYYDSTAARFCSADPLGGQLDDPQTWDRYAYVRNDPVNLTDPNGESWLSWLVDALLIGADVLTSGFFAPESAAILGTTETTLHTANLVFTGALGAAGAATAYEQTKSGGQAQSQKQPQAPSGYRPCPPAWFTITGVGPHQATGPVGGSHPNDPHPYHAEDGDVAYNPRDYGLSRADAGAMDRGDKSPLLFKPDWGTGKVPGKNGRGTVNPSESMPRVPDGLPVSEDDTLEGRDIIGGKGINRATQRNRIDLYRYPTDQQAKASERRVRVTVYIPIGINAHCPH